MTGGADHKSVVLGRPTGSLGSSGSPSDTIMYYALFERSLSILVIDITPVIVDCDYEIVS